MKNETDSFVFVEFENSPDNWNKIFAELLDKLKKMKLTDKKQ